MRTKKKMRLLANHLPVARLMALPEILVQQQVAIMRPVTQVINVKDMTAGPADGTLPVLADRIMVDNAPVKTAFTTGIECLGDVRGRVSPQPVGILGAASGCIGRCF